MALRLRITLTHLPTLERIQSILGGFISSRREIPPKRLSWEWCLSRQADVRNVLELLLPHLVTKREEALVALDYLRRRGPAKRGIRFTPAQRKDWEATYWKLRRLKVGSNKVPKNHP